MRESFWKASCEVYPGEAGKVFNVPLGDEGRQGAVEGFALSPVVGLWQRQQCRIAPPLNRATTHVRWDLRRRRRRVVLLGDGLRERVEHELFVGAERALLPWLARPVLEVACGIRVSVGVPR